MRRLLIFGSLLAVLSIVLRRWIYTNESCNIEFDLHNSLQKPPWSELRHVVLNSSSTGVPPEQLKPFKIEFSADRYEDLRRRLLGYRGHGSMNGSQNWDYGVDELYLRKFVDYWANEYDWPTHLNHLNSLPQYLLKIHEYDIHFIWVRAPACTLERVPLLLLHGWPGSVYEFYQLAEMINSNKDQGIVFDLVIPSLPGFGFSSVPDKRGFSIVFSAALFNKLMLALNYTSYFVQGGDWGSAIAQLMGRMYPSSVKGIHLNFTPLLPLPVSVFRAALTYAFPSFMLPDPVDQAKLFPVRNKLLFLLQNSGYFHMQATWPDSLGAAMSDSPAGFAGYLLKCFSCCQPCISRGPPECIEEAFTKDQLITNMMIYWISGTITSSFRTYYESMRHRTELSGYSSCQYQGPVGIADFPAELLPAPKPWLDQFFPKLVSYDRMPRGGHFAALEEPELLVQSIKKFVVLTLHPETFFPNG